MSDRSGIPVGRPARAAVRLLGRDRERAILNQFTFDVRSGQSRALVLRGEPGIGKTALLEDTVARAAGLDGSGRAGQSAAGDNAEAMPHAVGCSSSIAAPAAQVSSSGRARSCGGPAGRVFAWHLGQKPILPGRLPRTCSRPG